MSDATDLRDAYLTRLGLEAEPPSVDALVRLHRAQVERVPYETLWIQLGEHYGVDSAESLHRVATTTRGGYCFHLNGAFGELLGALGYDVVRHVGGVHGPDGPSEAELTNHLVLTVRGLPSDDHPDGTWYVDAGLGDALHDPLPLRAGTYEQGPFTLVLEETPDGVGDWHLQHDPAGGFTGMAWRDAPATLDAFAERHRWLSTSPESGFVKVLTVQARDATGVDVIRGLTLQRIGDGPIDTTLASKTELLDVLGDRFRIDLSALDAHTLDELWSRLARAHEAWEAAGRP
jgi:arylamine N-acetyltransferase